MRGLEQNKVEIILEYNNENKSYLRGILSIKETENTIVYSIGRYGNTIKKDNIKTIKHEDGSNNIQITTDEFKLSINKIQPNYNPLQDSIFKLFIETVNNAYENVDEFLGSAFLGTNKVHESLKLIDLVVDDKHMVGETDTTNILLYFDTINFISCIHEECVYSFILDTEVGIFQFDFICK